MTLGSVFLGFWMIVKVLLKTLTLTVQESPGVSEGDEAATGHVPVSTKGAEGQSPAHGSREEVKVRGDPTLHTVEHSHIHRDIYSQVNTVYRSRIMYV